MPVHEVDHDLSRRSFLVGAGAAGDDGSGNSNTVEPVVADSDVASDSATTSVNETEDPSGGDSTPTVDSLSLSEDNSGGSPHADFDPSWTVSDPDGDLASVDLTLTDTDTGESEDSVSTSIGGGSTSGTTVLKANLDEDNGHTYEVALVVTDSNGHTASSTATEVEDGS